MAQLVEHCTTSLKVMSSWVQSQAQAVMFFVAKNDFKYHLFVCWLLLVRVALCVLTFCAFGWCDQGHIVLVCLSLFLQTLANIFVYLPLASIRHIILHLSVCLSTNFNYAYNFWSIQVTVFIFNMLFFYRSGTFRCTQYWPLLLLGPWHHDPGRTQWGHCVSQTHLFNS